MDLLAEFTLFVGAFSPITEMVLKIAVQNSRQRQTPKMTPTQHRYRTPSRHSPTNELGQSSMVQRNASPVKENAPTDGEWYNVAQVLSTLRSHTLQATPAFTTRYAKQTTDIDVWAWKQTTNWENRKTIRKYLNKIDVDQAAASNADFAARFKMLSGAAQAAKQTARPNHREEEHEAQHRHRPRSAPMRRHHRNGQHHRTSHGPHVSRPHTATARDNRNNKQYRTQIYSPTDRWTTATATATATTVLSTPTQRRLQPSPQPQRQRQRRYPEHFQPQTRRISERQTNTQTAGQWVVGLAQGKATRSPGKQYTISRRRQRKFANVNHKDKLMLEKLTFRTRMKRIKDTNAAKLFQRRNGMV